MKSGAYIPPHLRNGAQNGNQEHSQGPRFGGSSRGGGYQRRGQNDYHNSRGGRGRGSQFSHSRSAPQIYRPTDEEIAELFKENQESKDGPDVSIYETDDIQVQTKVELEPMKDFPSSGIKNEVLLNVARNGYKVPTPVQKYSIPYTLKGEDLIVTSQTGSGKTAAFMLPVITQLIDLPRSRDPTCVALCPTRELAIQIFEETRKFCRGTEIKTTCVFGGAPIIDQIRNLNRGIDIVIATPGRLIDIMKHNCLSLSRVKFLILDEADRMLDMGFEPQIREVINGCDMPPANERQTMLFSATFPSDVQRLAREFMRPELTRISVGMQDAPNSIEQSFVYCCERDKFSGLLEVIREIDGPTLVFAERKASVDRIESFLLDEGTNVVAIHGDRQMNERLYALDAFTNGRAQIMVATDVAARGLDISHVTHVINLDLPTDLDTYTHRIGRTGRAGKTGRATSFYNENNTPFLNQLVSHIHSKNLPMPSGLENFKVINDSYGGHGGRGSGRGGYGRGNGGYANSGRGFGDGGGYSRGFGGHGRY